MGADNGMDAQDNAWAQLARRLEKTERAVREMRDERNAAVDRADALAAHVEMIRTARHKDHVGPGFSPAGYVAELQCAIDCTPTSLTHLKAEWQAEVLSFLESRIRPLEQRDNGAKGKGYNLALGDCLAALFLAYMKLFPGRSPYAKDGGELMGNNARQPGWYWVQVEDLPPNDPPKWEAAEWDGSQWHLVACDHPWRDEGIDQVGPRIPAPDEQHHNPPVATRGY